MISSLYPACLGTTWSGTLDKLAMPGLLFHHETRTKDYIHDIMKPWVHYIPISSTLHDLKEKFDWAEAHPEKAQKIAERATELVKRLGTPEGFEALSQEFFEGPLCDVVAAYQPLNNGMDWREFIKKHKSGNSSTLQPRWKCGGFMQGDCEDIGDRIAQNYYSQTNTVVSDSNPEVVVHLRHEKKTKKM